MSSSQVKGIWFSSLGGYLRQAESDAVFARLTEALPSEYREILRDPMVSEWYPEAALGAVLNELHRVVAMGDDDRFEELIKGATVHGVGRFFRVLLQLATPNFIVRKIPVLWGRMRRGDGVVRVEPRAGGACVHYTEFPHFDDVVYRRLTVGSIRGVAHITGSTTVKVAVLRHTHDSLDVDVVF